MHAEADDAIEAEEVSLLEPGKGGKGDDESRREKLVMGVGDPDKLSRGIIETPAVPEDLKDTEVVALGVLEAEAQVDVVSEWPRERENEGEKDGLPVR